VKEIEDPEVRVVVETSVAGAWLGVPMGQSVVIYNKKSMHGVMVGGPEAE
jgi:hypothetical protein